MIFAMSSAGVPGRLPWQMTMLSIYSKCIIHQLAIASRTAYHLTKQCAIYIPIQYKKYTYTPQYNTKYAQLKSLYSQVPINTVNLIYFPVSHTTGRDHFVYVPNQWEMMLHCNIISNWLGTFTKWFLHRLPLGVRYKVSVESLKSGIFPSIDQFHKSQNAPVPYPTMLHSEQKCAHFCSEWNIVGYGTGAFWDLWIRSIVNGMLSAILC